MAAIQTTDDLFGVAKWIVNPTLGAGTHTTIGSAITSASSGDTIFITPGTYTENLTLKAGVNLTAFGCDQGNGYVSNTGNVIIIGKATLTGTGIVTISGIMLETNSDFCIVLAGAGGTQPNLSLNNCYINCLNNIGMSITAGGSGGRLYLNNCQGNIGGLTASLMTLSAGAAQVSINGCYITSSANTSGVSTISSSSGGNFLIYNSYLEISFSLSSNISTAIQAYNSIFKCDGTSPSTFSVFATIGSSLGTMILDECTIICGSNSSCVAVSGSMIKIRGGTVDSLSPPFSGAGTIEYSGIAFVNSMTSISSATTTTRRTFDPGLLIGNLSGTAPSASYVGEYITSAIAFASAVTSTTTTVTNVTSISVTAGTWDISGIVMFTGMTTATLQRASLSTSSATHGTLGDNSIEGTWTTTTPGDIGLSIPAWRQNFTTTTIVYLVGSGTYSAGTGKVYGRISATRVC